MFAEVNLAGLDPSINRARADVGRSGGFIWRNHLDFGETTFAPTSARTVQPANN